MEWFDISLLIVIGVFGLFGLWFGFVHTVGSLLGTVLGVYLATRYYGPVAEWLMHVTGWQENTARVIMFIIAFILINRLVGIVFWFVDKSLQIVTKMPFISSVNHILGLLLGVVEGVITIGVILFFIEKYPLSETVTFWIQTSTVAIYAIPIAEVLLPLIPEGLRVLETSVDFVEAKVL